jgi:hypothetical protein
MQNMVSKAMKNAAQEVYCISIEPSKIRKVVTDVLHKKLSYRKAARFHAPRIPI